MTMGYNKCKKCDYVIKMATGNSMLMICTISGEEIETYECIMECGDLLIDGHFQSKKEEKKEIIKKSLWTKISEWLDELTPISGVH